MASEGRVRVGAPEPGPKFPVPSSKSKANGSSVPASQTSHDLKTATLRGLVSCDCRPFILTILRVWTKR
ncbi:GD13218 [Drosophila simulans]|uniref:GD13218 n=1 Tax=Drosophila simulans TaxID=7240 RepID=B4QR48_DROSI|nr:GD13218 [Drosophila simulans]